MHFLYSWDAQKFSCEQFTACFGFAATDPYRDGHNAVQLDRVGRLSSYKGVYILLHFAIRWQTANWTRVEQFELNYGESFVDLRDI